MFEKITRGLRTLIHIKLTEIVIICQRVEELWTKAFPAGKRHEQHAEAEVGQEVERFLRSCTPAIGHHTARTTLLVEHNGDIFRRERRIRRL